MRKHLMIEHNFIPEGPVSPNGDKRQCTNLSSACCSGQSAQLPEYFLNRT